MFNANDLEGFTGTENYYFNPLFRSIKYTDGCKFLSDNGAAWLVTDILSHLSSNRKVNREAFISAKFEKKVKGWLLTFDDGNGNIMDCQKYEYSDFPMPSIKFFITDNVMMLPSEY